MATAEFSKFAGILSAALSQDHLLGFETGQLLFHHFLWVAHHLNIIPSWIQEGGSSPPSPMDMKEAQVDIHLLIAWQLDMDLCL